MNTAIFMYAVTSPINGFFGGGLYARLGGNVYNYKKKKLSFHFYKLLFLISLR